MCDTRRGRRIRRVRGEVLRAMKMVYPGAMRGRQLLRSLLVIWPDLEWEHFRKDLAYLQDKGYVRRVVAGAEDPAEMPWRRRYFRLTAAGVEVADECVRDPALEV